MHQNPNQPNPIIPKTKTVSGTGEWCKYNATFINGCEHDCLYCYSKAMAIRFQRKTRENWTTEEVREDDLNKRYHKRDGRFFFPSSHDIIPKNLSSSIEFLSHILTPGNEVLIVSKPHLECIQEICRVFADYKDKILFRFTIGSANSKTLKFWEPNAPSFEERFECLKLAFNEGFQTSISCEPMLDETIHELISITRPYISDALWIGKANRLKSIIGINTDKDPEILRAAEHLLDFHKDENIWKIYEKYKDDSMIKWKESIKKVVGIGLLKEKGMDI